MHKTIINNDFLVIELVQRSVDSCKYFNKAQKSICLNHNHVSLVAFKINLELPNKLQLKLANRSVKMTAKTHLSLGSV